MALPQSLITALEAAEVAAKSASGLRDQNNDSAGLWGPAVISEFDGEIIVDTPMRAEKLSNHGKLDATILNDRLTTCLRNVMAELRSLLPEYNLTYTVDPTSAKHSLEIDNQPLLMAVISSWKTHLPIILDLYATEPGDTLWLIDTNCRINTSTFPRRDCVRAPTLATALARRDFTRLTLAERRQKKTKKSNLYAAAILTPATDPVATKSKTPDKKALAQSWEAFQSRVFDIQTRVPADISIKIETPPGQNWDIVKSVDLHPMLHEDDCAEVQAVCNEIETCLRDLAMTVNGLAPNAELNVDVKIFSTRGPIVRANIGTDTFGTTSEFVAAVIASEAAGHVPHRLHAVMGYNDVHLVQARNADEASSICSKISANRAPADFKIFLATPVSQDILDATMKEIQSQ